MAVNLAEFAQFQFPRLPRDRVAVYVVALGGFQALKPIYVGKTETSLKGRMGHYLTASKDTAPDFVVGTAITLLQDMGRDVVVCYRLSNNPSAEESQLIRHYFEEGVNLLNSFPKYSSLTNCPNVNVKSLQSEVGRGNARESITRYVDRLV